MSGHRATPEKGKLRQLLRQRNYCLYAGGDLVSVVGNWTQRIAIGWLTWELTGSGAWLGVIAFADLFPSIVLSPIGGVVADRGEPRRIVMRTQSVAMLNAAVMAAAAFAGVMDIWLLLALTVLRGSIAAINQPARLAFVPSLIPRDLLPSALAVNSMFFNSARFVGPALAGVVIVEFGVAAAFAVNAASYVALLGALALIDVAPPERAERARRSVFAQVAAGYRYVVGHAGLGPLMLLFAAGSLLVRPITELLPGFADGVFGMGAGGLAAMTSAMGVGAMLGGAMMVRFGSYDRLLALNLATLAAMSLSVAAAAYAPSYWLALGLLALVGGAITANGISAQTLIQATVDDAMRGRVMSLYGMIFRGVPAVGAVVMGAASDHLGLAAPVAAGGAICLVAWAWSLRRRDGLKRALAG